MKYQVPEISLAWYEFAPKIARPGIGGEVGRCCYLADAARDCHYRNAGDVGPWPLRFVVADDAGAVVAEGTVDRRSEPVFEVLS